MSKIDIKKLDFFQISNLLLEADENLAEKERELFQKEIEYQDKRNEIMMSDQVQGYGNQTLRDARTDELMRKENTELFIEYHTLALNVRQAYRRWQSLKESCANLRSASYGEARSG